MSLFSRMPQHCPKSCGAMLVSFARSGSQLFPQADHLFSLLPQWHLRACNLMIGIYGEQGAIDRAERLFLNRMEEHDLLSWTSIVGAHAQCGDMASAERKFRLMPMTDKIVWTIMLIGFSEDLMFQEAVETFDSMPERDLVAWTGMIMACAHNQEEEHTLKLMEKMPWWDVVSWNSAVWVYAQGGRMNQAVELFMQIPEWNTHSWNVLLAGYSQDGDFQNTLEVFQLMQLQGGCDPDPASFVCVLQSCSHSSRVEAARDVFMAMEGDFEVSAEKKHYGCMVDVLGRAGHLQEAEELVCVMPFVPDCEWNALLGACRSHRDVERAERVARRALERGDETLNAAPYVLLGNVFASDESNGELAIELLQRMMKRRGIRRKPGISSVRVGNRVHRFVVDDNAHPQMELVQVELQRLGSLIREAGYVADTGVAFSSGSEEEKRETLCRHSEKLALAFGLMSSEAGDDSAIRITKNLRMCYDCHDATRLVSKVVGRKIVVRDANRIHRFQDGVCSCRNMW